MLEKLNSFRLSGLFLVCCMDGSALEEKSSSKMLRLSFSFKLDWDSYIISIAKSASKKIEALIRSKFLSPEVALYLYKTPPLLHFSSFTIYDSL